MIKGEMYDSENGATVTGDLEMNDLIIAIDLILLTGGCILIGIWFWLGRSVDGIQFWSGLPLVSAFMMGIPIVHYLIFRIWKDRQLRRLVKSFES